MENENKRPYKIRKLSELSLIDDFLFGLFIQDAYKELIKGILEIYRPLQQIARYNILDMKITDITFIDRQHNMKNDPEYGGKYMSYEEALYEGEAIGMEKGEEKGIKKGEAIGKIKGAVETYFDFGKSPEETAAAIIKKFSLSDDEAKEYMRLYYPAAD